MNESTGQVVDSDAGTKQSENNVKKWEEYIGLIISFYESTFGSHIVTIDSKYADVIKFFDQFIINIHDCKRPNQ